VQKAMTMTELNKLPLVLVPCFSGAPWDTASFPQWKNREMITGQLPNAESMDEYADIVSAWTKGIGDYVLIGDSFGASVALLLAERQPEHLKALVMSGGFAKADVTLFTRLRVVAAKIIGQRGYPLTVKMHVRSLSSHFDPPGTQEELRQLFLKHSDAKTFIKRGTLVLKADLRPGLSQVKVPTLILTPEEDRLIGPESANELKSGIQLATEEILKGTGHLLRFTHETAYAEAVDRFLEMNSRLSSDSPHQ
jgi:pimeloyl-ACP methyl ester carboxylesterase